MRFKQLDGFLAVVEHGSIRAASRQLGISQPSLSKSLATLERELGTSLLERTVSGAVPTVIGRTFLPRARAIRADLQRAREEIAHLRGERGGRLAIGSSPAPAFELIPQTIADICAAYPGAFVRLFEMIYPASLQGLRDGSIDLAVAPLPAKRADVGSDISVRTLYRNRVLLAVRRGNPLARARSLRELVDAEWVRAGTPAGPARVVDEAFAAAGLPPPRYRVQCETVLALSELAASGDFVAIVPQQVLAPERGGGRLLRINVREHIEPVSIAILTRAQAPLTPLARDFIRLLRDRAQRKKVL
jgi:DNA-binding transcriptional LysR family regulator